MIDYFFGKPRTGKTYRAVDLIYNDYISEKSETPKYRNILTNIGGFKFKEINEIFSHKGSTSLAYRLVWKDFYIHLKALFEMALDDKSDNDLNRYADYHKINDCLIVIDEASLYMKKYDDVISWWLAYHGHFRIRIIIIAQSPKQINSEYLVHAEIYYEAQPQSKRISNNKLRYIHYSEPYFNKDSKFSSDIISTKKDIYDLYKSGEVDKPKKILYKFLFFMILAIFFMIGMFKLLMYKLSPDIPQDEEQFKQVEEQSENYNSSQYYSTSKLITFRCNDRYCWLTGNKYIQKSISKSYLKFVIVTNDLELTYNEVSNEIYKLINLQRGQSKITLASFTDYSYFIPKSVQDDYFSDLFVLEKEEKQKKTDFKSLFSQNQTSK